MTTTTTPTAFAEAATITHPLTWRLTAGAVLTAATVAATGCTVAIGALVHPVAGAAMVPAGAALFVAIVAASNPSKAGR